MAVRRMSSLTDLDPVLLRQLKKAGSPDPATLPSPEAWGRFVGAVSDYYRHLNDDRALLTRSMELSTHEMEELRHRIEGQRDQLSSVVDAIGEALGMFGGIVHSESGGSNVTDVEHAKREFSTRLHELFGADGTGDSSQLSGIRANLVSLADQLIRLLSETAERASMKKELEVARVVQNLLVPAESIIERSGLRVAGHFEPASECGGDWWSVTDLAAGRILVIIGDVTGHGISSAIITGAAKAACDLACQVTQGQLSPADLLRMMNATIHETARRQIMMTCAAAIFDPVTRSLTIANAGHHFPYLIRDGQVRALMVHGQPLGASSGSAYETTQLTVEPGDVLVWYTDGVVECENELGEQFSEKRLRAIAQRAAGEGAKAVRDAVVDAVTSFRRHVPQLDDMTMVVAQVK